ncbi:MAG: hypothetical protein DMF93_06365 [Acidobacteria bacterium]|nr:MAG: hypothetical protein DMF93_06365 [Acidobacteriota bacterium]
MVAVTVQDADEGDTATSVDTLIDAAEQVETVVPDAEIKEVVADKGYHSHQVMTGLEAVGVRSYISEPDRGRRNWKNNPEARDAVYRNRRRIRGARGRRLLRQRGERLERPCAHLYGTGRMRRVHLRGHDNIRKRLLVHAGALNLGLLMRTLFTDTRTAMYARSNSPSEGLSPRAARRREGAIKSSGQSLANSLPNTRYQQDPTQATGTTARESEDLYYAVNRRVAGSNPA